MNTPRQPKPLVRYDPKRTGPKREHKGTFVAGLQSDAFAVRLGKIASTWPHVEEVMVDVMGVLFGDITTAKRWIFRSIINQQGRIEIMRNLLQNLPRNSRKDETFDEVIDEFAALNHVRNAYVHGIWSTHAETGRAFLAEPMGDHIYFLKQRRVTEKELDRTLARMHTLINRVRLGLGFPQSARSPETLGRFPEKFDAVVMSNQWDPQNV